MAAALFPLGDNSPIHCAKDLHERQEIHRHAL
jgi:hypothetical protein